MRTAYLGPPGTFSEDAALQHTGGDGELIPLGSIPAMVSAVETGLADQAILPAENTLEGSISATLDALIHETGLQIVAETVVPVRLMLIGVPGAKVADIAMVTTHPNPLGQSRRFLERIVPRAEQVAALSTAAAVRDVVESGDPTRAAIGTERSAAMFGGEILARDIQDVRTNATRFVVIGREAIPPTGKDKTSLAFWVAQDVPGSVFRGIEPLARAKIQMTKIESRPSKTVLFEYVFLVDVLGHQQDPDLAAALAEMRSVCRDVKVFGSYPQFDMSTLAMPGGGPQD